MLKSMTGFGRCEMTTDEYKISVEMKAVNHRYLDLSIKMPKRFNHFETGIRNLLKNHIQRGKVDVFINFEDYTEDKLCLRYNQSLAAEYMAYFEQMSEQFEIENDIRVSHLSRYPEVLIMEAVEADETVMRNILEQAVKTAAQNFVDSRIQEGESLRADLLAKLSYMEELVSEVELRSPQILSQYRSRLEEKVRDLLANTTVDEGRLMTEVTIFADKICVDEETVRLRSHIEHTRTELLQGGSIGRKLDFIAQEMNREANTILSKANDLEVSDKAIALKTEIEKVREQIQNIE